MKQLPKSRLINYVLICLIFVLSISCQTVHVTVEDSPIPIPNKLDAPVPDQDSTVNEYTWLVRESRWELLYAEIQMLTLNITPDEYNVERDRLMKKIAAYEAAMDSYLKSISE